LFSNEALVSINSSNNFIENLILTKNQSLEILNCAANNLKQLDISQNNDLRGLNCSDNGLKCLNAKNGNNSNFLYFDATGNKDLQCVDVDDPAQANFNWSSFVDPGVSFSTFCSSPCSTTLIGLFSDQAEFSIYPNPTSGLITIKTNSTNSINVEVYDIFGSLVLISNETNIDLGQFAAGTYHVKIFSESTTVTQKIIKY